MAESFRALGAGAKTGMLTGAESTRAVCEAWARIRSDSDNLVWAVFTVVGKDYVLVSEGTDDLEGFSKALTEDGVFFGGLRVSNKFFRVLYVGTEVGVIKKNKAMLQKTAPFNAMEGSIEIHIPTGEKHSLINLIRPHL